MRYGILLAMSVTVLSSAAYAAPTQPTVPQDAFQHPVQPTLVPQFVGILGLRDNAPQPVRLTLGTTALPDSQFPQGCADLAVASGIARIHVSGNPAVNSPLQSVTVEDSPGSASGERCPRTFNRSGNLIALPNGINFGDLRSTIEHKLGVPSAHTTESMIYLAHDQVPRVLAISFDGDRMRRFDLFLLPAK